FIYLLIVGTYTPVALVYLHGGGLSALFAAMWIVAAIGFLSKTWWRHRIEGISLTAYVVLGWMPILGIRTAWQIMPPAPFWFFIAGGLCYTAGLYFLLKDE